MYGDCNHADLGSLIYHRDPLNEVENNRGDREDGTVVRHHGEKE